MNIAEAVANFLEEHFFFELGKDLFIGVAPHGSPDPCMWITYAGGYTNTRNQSGERIKTYLLNIYYRSDDAKDVYGTLYETELLFNSADCIQLEGFDTILTNTISFPTDQDIDLEDRTVGLLTVSIETYGGTQ